MIQRIILSVLGVVAGIVVGMVVMMGLHMLSAFVYPVPEGVDFMSQEPENVTRLQEWFGTLPAGAFLLATVCHGLGCMVGALVAMLISGRRSTAPALIVGIFFTACGIINLSSLPHPAWFPFVDLPAYLVFALAAGLVLKRPGSTLSADTPGE
ncbi:hypothetical protein GC176_04930 [bacterium]|nr:hypothetical protein [bacterium]